MKNKRKIRGRSICLLILWIVVTGTSLIAGLNVWFAIPLGFRVGWFLPEAIIFIKLFSDYQVVRDDGDVSTRFQILRRLIHQRLIVEVDNKLFFVLLGVCLAPYFLFETDPGWLWIFELFYYCNVPLFIPLIIYSTELSICRMFSKRGMAKSQREKIRLEMELEDLKRGKIF